MNRSRRNVTKKNSDLELAHQLLHPSNLVNELPCRERQYDDIFNFVKSSLLEQVGGCMFVSGVPGTGKTATVLRVMRNLADDEDLKPIKNDMRLIEINALKLSDANQFYAHFYYTLFGQKPSKQKAIEELEDFFQNPDPKEQFIVLLVDELDQLCTKKQNILYHLFDWPNRPGSRIVIISIANTMDLPERVMMTKIQSRLGLRRLQFQAYKYVELIKIVNSRLQSLKTKLFNDDGIALIARKVAAISGDARRVLDLCRRSLDIAEQKSVIVPTKNQPIIVTINDVSDALKEVFSTDKVIAISNCTEQEKIFLQCLIQEFKISNTEVIYLDAVYSHHVEKCRFEKIYVPTVQELIAMAYDLYAMRLILIEKNKLNVKSKIQLNVSPDEIDYALR